MFEFLKRKSNEDKFRAVLNRSKTVKISGITFEVRKLVATDHVRGFKVMLEVYKTYSDQVNSIPSATEKKGIQHMRDVFMASVISPKLSLKGDEPDAVYVEDLFRDIELYTELYNEIISYTYGKKKSSLNWLESE